MALSTLPKLAATFMALSLIITIASSSREMRTTPREVGYLSAKIIIEDGKILVVEPEPKLVKPVIKEVTDEHTLKCIAKNGYCNELIANDCCFPYTCKKLPVIGGLCM